MNQHFSYTKIKRTRSLLSEVGSRDPSCLGLEACTIALACVTNFTRLLRIDLFKELLIRGTKPQT